VLPMWVNQSVTYVGELDPIFCQAGTAWLPSFRARARTRARSRTVFRILMVNHY
jgi:hypothetical protein